MRDRSPTVKLVIAGLIGLVLLIPIIMVYDLVNDRQNQARIAESTITAGAGGSQVISTPVLAVPYLSQKQVPVLVDGKSVMQTQQVRSEIVLAPVQHSLETQLDTERKKKAIYETVVFSADMIGQARFELPDDLSGYEVTRDQLVLSEAQLRFGVSDARGLRGGAKASLGGETVELAPGQRARGEGSGFHGTYDWSESDALDLEYSYTLRGSRSLSLAPEGGDTRWNVTSSWQHPGFEGRYLPDTSDISDEGFSANWSIGTLAIGQGPAESPDAEIERRQMSEYAAVEEAAGVAWATIALVEPGDIYAQVDRSVKYGFLFIGFTFLAFLLFDVIGGARVAAAEYLLTGAGLVLFFVLLLAFAEVAGFALAYLIASAAIIGLLTAYSAAVLGGWKRAGFIGGLLIVLYAGLYVLMSLEEASLIVGSVAMFFALAGVMYATRNLDWSQAVREPEQTYEA
ncbi:cell envelope integrity protein CreD [Erythrobacter aquimaris]|uniref:Cell envelope integrity protein CreD n=1 Tax=Qipengyuania aquimaris TaxID=255984 RepID=A0A6I4TLX1_9SPHN|nr:cell envelope integrity protein CreD [Qipengyuania aquimaris]MXO95553.1 cell envelope integrity protein CreD [Qipengyuania aquimaris]